jgi:hypothetical protein
MSRPVGSAWRKSSYSGSNGGDCVEVGTWRKSSYSAANGGECVEVTSGTAIRVRDTADRGGVTLSVPATAWTAFLASVR